VQRGQHGPVRRHGHLVDGEGDLARGLAFRGVDEADSFGRDEQADGYSGFAKETFEAGLRGRVPAVFLGCGAGFVEIGSPRKFFDEDQVLGLTLTPTDIRMRGRGRFESPLMLSLTTTTVEVRRVIGFWDRSLNHPAFKLA
jgi:hypothetical protein